MEIEAKVDYENLILSQSSWILYFKYDVYPGLPSLLGMLKDFYIFFGDFLKLQIRELLPLHKKFMDLKAQLELKLYDLKLFQGRAEQNEHHKVLLHSFLSLRYSKHRTMLSTSFSGSFLNDS